MPNLLEQSAVKAYFRADDVLSIWAMSVIEDADLKVSDSISTIDLNEMQMVG